MARKSRRAESPELVAVAARSAKARCSVVDAAESSLIVLPLVAAEAIGRRPVEGSISHLHVALGAWQDGVATDQWEVGPAMGVSGEQRLPVILFMAAFAALAQLSTVRIAVTTHAELGQRRLEVCRVTGFAIQPLMDAFQWEAGWGVIKGGGGPGRRRVTEIALGLRAG